MFGSVSNLPTFSKISPKLLQSTPPESSHPSSTTLGKQTTQHSTISLMAEVHVELDVIYMTVPMESPSADWGLHHEDCIATKEVITADTSRNIQAYMVLVQMTHITTHETSAGPIKSKSTSITATTGAVQQVMVMTTSVLTPIPSVSALTDVIPPPPPLVEPSARLPKRSSSSKSKSSSSKPSSLKELKSSSHPELGFTHRMYHLDSDNVKLECDTHHLGRILAKFLSTGMTATRVKMYQLGTSQQSLRQIQTHLSIQLMSLLMLIRSVWRRNTLKWIHFTSLAST